MFSSIFGSKIEKELKAQIQNGPELEVRYEGGDASTISLVVKIFHNSITILGFNSKLKDNRLDIKILATGYSFRTKILRTGKDSAGSPLFFCKMPEKLKPPTKRVQRHRIYPNGSAKLLLNTNRGEQIVTLPIWEFCEYGVILANTSKVHIQMGTRLFQAMLTIGGGQTHLVDMQVANLRKRKEEPQLLLVCLFSKPPRLLSELLTQAKGLVPKPKPAPKK